MPMIIEKGASVNNSMICSGCFIKGKVSSSIVSPGVRIEEGATVENSIIFHRCRIGRKAKIKNTIIDKASYIGEKTVIGYGDRNIANILKPSYLNSGVTLIGKKTIVPRGINIGTNCIIAGSPRNGVIGERDYKDGDYFMPEVE
jgi:glucose-1-phosphate adenylyltransferase